MTIKLFTFLLLISDPQSGVVDAYVVDYDQSYEDCQNLLVDYPQPNNRNVSFVCEVQEGE